MTDLQPASRDRGPVRRAEHQDLRAMLRQALAALPPTLRTAVVLRDMQELSYQEIADRLCLPEGTVKSRINRGRIELARADPAAAGQAAGPPAQARRVQA